MPLPKSQPQHHIQQLTGVKGAVLSTGTVAGTVAGTVEQGLKLYGTLKGVYDIGRSVYQGVQVAAPIIAGLL